MLYLITPDGTVRTAEASLGEALLDAGQRRRRLADLDWAEDLTGAPADLVLALALRHGIDARTGLLVHGGFVEQAREPERLRAAQANQRQVTAQLESIADEPRFEDRQWHRASRAVAEEARQDANGSLRKAEEAAQELLEAPVKDHLATAWQRAGGLLPSTGAHAAG